MIQFQFKGSTGPLSARAVMWRAGFVIAAFPLGWVMMLAGGKPPAAVSVVGIALQVAACLASLLVVPTAIQRVAGGVEQGLDEFELQLRLRAQSQAYRWFSGLMVLLFSYAVVAAGLGFPMDTRGDAFLGLVFWVMGYSIVLPAFFLSRALPQAQGD